MKIMKEMKLVLFSWFYLALHCPVVNQVNLSLGKNIQSVSESKPFFRRVAEVNPVVPQRFGRYFTHKFVAVLKMIVFKLKSHCCPWIVFCFRAVRAGPENHRFL